jgi:hypothetical protein
MDITEISGTKADLENMVERMARGLRFVMYGVPSDRPLDSSSPWFLYAKTTIRDMREPTHDMIAAANRNNHPRDEETWRTMIDTALGINT